MEKKKKILNNIKSRKLQKITIVVSTAIVIAICTWRINYLIQLDQNEKVYEQLRAEYIEEPVEQGQQLNSDMEESVKEPGASEEEVQTTLDAPALQETNSDIYAWITVDNTKINYPILQNEKDDYYLEHCINLKKGLPGCIYTNSCSQKDFSSWNTVIYGHNMKNGTMFGSLKLEKDFFDNLNTVNIFTENQKICYEIFAIVEFPDVYIPDIYNEEKESDRDKYIQDIKKAAEENGYLRDGINITTDTPIITLSTCIKGKENKRLLVVAVQQ